jgi:hypothetical protein
VARRRRTAKRNQQILARSQNHSVVILHLFLPPL